MGCSPGTGLRVTRFILCHAVPSRASSCCRQTEGPREGSWLSHTLWASTGIPQQRRGPETYSRACPHARHVPTPGAQGARCPQKAGTPAYTASLAGSRTSSVTAEEERGVSRDRPQGRYATGRRRAGDTAPARSPESLAIRPEVTASDQPLFLLVERRRDGFVTDFLLGAEGEGGELSRIRVLSVPVSSKRSFYQNGSVGFLLQNMRALQRRREGK